MSLPDLGQMTEQVGSTTSNMENPSTLHSPSTAPSLSTATTDDLPTIVEVTEQDVDMEGPIGQADSPEPEPEKDDDAVGWDDAYEQEV